MFTSLAVGFRLRVIHQIISSYGNKTSVISVCAFWECVITFRLIFNLKRSLGRKKKRNYFFVQSALVINIFTVRAQQSIWHVFSLTWINTPEC